MTAPLPRPIRVLYVIDRLLSGGTEKQLIGLIRSLDRARVEPHLCTLKPSEIALTTVGCPALELPFVSFGSAGIVDVVRRARSYMRGQGIEVVHTFFQDPTVLGLLSSVGTGIRARVVAFRDLGFWRTAAKAAQLRLVYPLADAFVANSAAVAAAHRSASHVASRKLRVIFNGIDVPISPPRPRDFEHPIVCCVANLDRQVKRVDLFLSSAAIVAQSRPGVRFVIVGDGPLRPQLERLAAELGITPQVTFTGRLRDVAGALAAATVGVVCSDSEGFSNAVLEFMAHGVVCVARRVGGNPEAVVHGCNGLLVDDDTPESLAAQVLAVLSAPARAQAMQHAGYKTVQTQFSWARHASEHADLYAELLAPDRIKG